MRKLKNRPAIAIAMIAYFVLSSVGGAVTCAAGTAETIQELFSETRQAEHPTQTSKPSSERHPTNVRAKASSTKVN
jgi:hypothetical protein